MFLPGAKEANAADVAERIRRAIAETAFLPNGARHPLSVSVGGAVYDARIDFSDLFRVADRRLYEAKEAGRNRVQLSGPAEMERRPSLH